MGSTGATNEAEPQEFDASPAKRYNQSGFYSFGATDPLFLTEHATKFDKYVLDLTHKQMNSHGVELLRRHDYFKGWLDCKKNGHLSSLNRRGKFLLSEHPQIGDRDHPEREMVAGANAGGLFTWAALNERYNADHNIRLDDRQWAEIDLDIPTGCAHYDFWVAVAFARYKVVKHFDEDYPGKRLS